MTSRERVRAAIAHKEPERVPIDCGAAPRPNISAIACNNLEEYLGINTIHNITPDVPPRNLVAMLDAVKEFNANG